MNWRIYLAIFLILGGGMTLLGNFGLLSSQAWIYLIGVACIVGGLVLLWRARPKPLRLERVAATAPLENATRATFNFKHGAGILKLSADADATRLFAGTFDGAVVSKVSRADDDVRVSFKTPSEIWSQLSQIKTHALEWNVTLNRNIPIALQYEGGAGEAQIDCTELYLTDLDLETGASPTHVILPSPRGALRVVIHSGAAPVRVRVPTAARVSIHGAPGLGLLDADAKRFPEREPGILQSDGYAEAADRIEITIEGGIAPVEIR